MSAKKKIHKLSFELESDFRLIGIASHENDYRLSWAVNNSLGIELIKTEDLIITHPKHKIQIDYSMYNFNDDNNFISYHLISNKSEKGFLLPEMKNLDFVLKVSGEPDIDFLKDLLRELKKVNIIITAFFIDDLPDKIKNVFVF
ncbi:MAG: IPExxxVDY family protein [Bacteroidales bacterium]|nr:IPExxxVDY family protein [Bacteroidales bacterium]